MKEHGSYSIKRQQSILVLRIYGGWNVEASNELWEQVIAISAEFQGKPWAILCDLREWGLSTPDSVAMGPEVAASLDRLGRTHTAMIFGQKIMARITAELAFDSDQRIAPLKFFENESAARQWLGENGFESELTSEALTWDQR